MIIKALKNRYIKDNIIFMVGTALAGFLGYLFHFFVARKLTVSEYGEVQSVFSLVAMFGMFAAGISYFVIKYSSLFAVKNDYSANDEFVFYLNKKIIKIAFIILPAFFIFVPFIKNILRLSDVWGILAGIFAVIFGTMAVVFQETLRAWQKFLALSIAGVLGAAIKLIFGYGFAVFFGTASAVIFSLTVSSFLVWLVVIYFWKKLRRKTWNKEKKHWDDYILRKKIWKNAIQIFFFSFVSSLLLNIDILLVKGLTTPETAGYYSALSIFGKIILLLNMSIVGVALPRACRDGHQGKDLRSKIFFISFCLMIVIGLLITFIYFLASEALVITLFGQKYQGVSGNLWLFGLMALILSLLKFEADLAFARHNFRINYLLLFTVFVMTFAVFERHSNLSEIAVFVSASLLIGYFLAVFLNFSNRKKKIIEPMI